MQALVTGATGFVGSHLAEELVRRGDRVRCLVRRAGRDGFLRTLPVEIVPADLLDPAPLKEAARGADVVYHVAGVLRAGSVEEFRRGNLVATRHLLDAAPASARFVYVSSLAACGPSSEGRPLTEESPCAPLSLYGRSKWEAEGEAWGRRGSRPVTIMRPPVVYGPRDQGLLELYRTLAMGVKPRIGGPKFTSVVHARDLARGIADAAGPAGEGRIYFLANREAWRFTDLMEAMLRAMERRAVAVPVPDRMVRLLGGVVEDASRVFGWGPIFSRDKALEMTQKYWVCSPERARRELGWEARIGVEEGLRETMAWFKSLGG